MKSSITLFKKLWNEEFREVTEFCSKKLKYAISNYGRLISYADRMENGRVLKGGHIDGYHFIQIKRWPNGKVIYINFFLHKLVAMYFIPKENEDQMYVLHIDFDKGNNVLKNLKWATKKEMIEHHKVNPKVLAAIEKTIKEKGKPHHAKLTATKVMLIKKKLLDPNRRTRIKMLAKQFGVSEMQLHRIKTGENWGHIKV